MRKQFLFLVLGHFSLLLSAQIIADHTVVDQYDKIPQQYIDAVKTMLVSVSGESHSLAYRIGMELLEKMDNNYKVQTYDSYTPPASTEQNLRIGGHITMGEDYFFSEAKIAELKDDISSQYNTGNPFHIMGFGWCWDMTWMVSPGGIEDTVYRVHFSSILSRKSNSTNIMYN